MDPIRLWSERRALPAGIRLAIALTRCRFLAEPPTPETRAMRRKISKVMFVRRFLYDGGAYTRGRLSVYKRPVLSVRHLPLQNWCYKPCFICRFELAKRILELIMLFELANIYFMTSLNDYKFCREHYIVSRIGTHRWLQEDRTPRSIELRGLSPDSGSPDVLHYWYGWSKVSGDCLALS